MVNTNHIYKLMNDYQVPLIWIKGVRRRLYGTKILQSHRIGWPNMIKPKIELFLKPSF